MILLLVLSAPKELQAGDPTTSDSRSIQFSSPAGNTLTTNYNQLGLPETGASSIEGNYPTAESAGVSRSSGSMTAVPVVPQVVVPGNGPTSLLDQKDSWAFATPDGLLRNYVATEILKLPQLGVGPRGAGFGQVAGGAFQRIPSESNGGPTAAEAMRNAAVDSFLGVQKPAGNLDDNSLTEGTGRLSGADALPSPFQSLTSSDRGLVGSLVPAAAQPTGISDLIGLGSGNYGAAAPDAARVRQSQQTQLEEFKKLLGFQTQLVPGIGGALAAPSTQTSSSTPGTPAYPGATASIPGQGNSPFNPLLGTVNPLSPTPSPAAPSAPVAPPPGRSSFLQNTPSASAAKATASQPSFAPPHRAF